MKGVCHVQGNDMVWILTGNDMVWIQGYPIGKVVSSVLRYGPFRGEQGPSGIVAAGPFTVISIHILLVSA